MTLRSISWIADSGLLVGLTLVDEFAASPILVPLSLSTEAFVQAVPASGTILGATTGSAIAAMGLPAGMTIGPGASWAYDGTGTTGTFVFALTETLSGAGNSPLATSITVTVSPAEAPGATFDFSQPGNSDLIAATRSF